jgi:phospholipase D1/2
VEALYLDLIAAARDAIYIENQYFTAHKIGEALAKRLAEPEGPEVIVVLRLLSHGWLEELTMQNLRKALIGRLRAADQHHRLHIYYPHIEGLADGTCIDVHSKVLIVDDDWLRVGSANICNRSMGFDTECDLTVEARGRGAVRKAIAAFRHRLLAEHLGVEPRQVQEAVHEQGSIAGAVESLRSPQRTLQRLQHEPEVSNAVITLASLADPEQPVTVENLVTQFAPRTELRRVGLFWIKLAGLAALVLGLTALWRFTPLAQWLTPERITAWANAFGNAPWAPFAVMAAYIPAAAVMFPRPVITLFAVVAFGPWLGFIYAMSGILLSALLTYLAGMRLDRSTVRRMSGPKLNRIISVLRQRGLVAMTALRLVPLAPFAVEGVIAGAIRIRLLDFMAGTALGMLPGTLAATVFGDQLEIALHDPSKVNVWLIAGVVVLLVTATIYVRRWLLTTEIHAHESDASRD